MVRIQFEGDPTKLEETVDNDIDQFNESFRRMGNEGLVRSERAILKTYLGWKLGVTRTDEKQG